MEPFIWKFRYFNHPVPLTLDTEYVLTFNHFYIY